MPQQIMPAHLRDIAEYIPSIILDIRYATSNNFTGQQQYNRPTAWLRQEPLIELKKAVKDLDSLGYTLVIFDAFRPTSVQERLRSIVDNDDYVMQVSNHSRGITIDVTIAKDGVYTDMGTEYDDFTEKAHPGTHLITQQQTANRKILSDILQKYGFVQHPHEWWHFDYCPDKDWPVVDDHSNTYNT